ncbi:hypothetical protein BDR05DRAFT_186570 [Suillus weaverae]|nr:hypothetical protein BDR05DRAFT_186570 [Suillus weaverae]
MSRFDPPPCSLTFMFMVVTTYVPLQSAAIWIKDQLFPITGPPAVGELWLLSDSIRIQTHNYSIDQVLLTDTGYRQVSLCCITRASKTLCLKVS